MVYTSAERIDIVLDMILGLRKVTMAYKNYDTEIVAKHHVCLVGQSKAVIGHGGPVEPVRPGVLVVFSVIF